MSIVQGDLRLVRFANWKFLCIPCVFSETPGNRANSRTKAEAMYIFGHSRCLMLVHIIHRVSYPPTCYPSQFLYFSFPSYCVRALFTFGDMLFPTLFSSAIICHSRFQDCVTVPFYVALSCFFLRPIRVCIIHVSGSDHGQTMPITIVLSRTELLHNHIIVAHYVSLETHPASQQPDHH